MYIFEVKSKLSKREVNRTPRHAFLYLLDLDGTVK